MRYLFECKIDRRGPGNQLAVLIGDGEWETDLPRQLGRILFGACYPTDPVSEKGPGRRADCRCLCPHIRETRPVVRVVRWLVSLYLLSTSQLLDQSAMDHAEKRPLPQEVEGAWKTRYQRVKVKQ